MKDNKTIYVMREMELQRNSFQKEGRLRNVNLQSLQFYDLLIIGKTTEYFPQHSEVEDECGKLDGEEKCDNDKVQTISSSLSF